MIILSNLVAILTGSLATILDLQLIIKKIWFGQIGFLDPQNMGLVTKITTLK